MEGGDLTKTTVTSNQWPECKWFKVQGIIKSLRFAVIHGH